MGKKIITAKEYFDEIEKCKNPDTLNKKFGISDNWPLLVYNNHLEKHKHDYLFEKICDDFEEMKGWSSFNESHNKKRFIYNPGVVRVQLKNLKSRKGQPYYTQKISGLNPEVCIMFHPYQEKKVKNTHDTLVMALAIADIGRHAIKNNLSINLPRSEPNNLQHIPSFNKREGI